MTAFLEKLKFLTIMKTNKISKTKNPFFNKINLGLIYLLIALLPTQLGKHFFFAYNPIVALYSWWKLFEVYCLFIIIKNSKVNFQIILKCFLTGAAVSLF